MGWFVMVVTAVLVYDYECYRSQFRGRRKALGIVALTTREAIAGYIFRAS